MKGTHDNNTDERGAVRTRLGPKSFGVECRGRAWILPLLVALVFACGAQAQRALVVTSSLSATRQSARIYAQAVDLDAGTVLPGGATLPGSSLCCAPLAGVCAKRPDLADGLIALTTGPSEPPLHPEPGFPETSVTLVRPSPFNVPSRRCHDSEAGWREWAADLRQDPSSPGLLILGTRTAGEDGDTAVGRARLFSVDGGAATKAPPRQAGALLAEWPLPGRPVAAVWAAAAQSALVLCADPPGGAPLLVKCQLGLAEPRRCAASSLPGWNPACADARGLVALPDSEYVVAAFSGRIPGGSSAEPVSQLYAVNADELSASPAAPVPVRGMVEWMGASGRNTVWTASRAPGTDFAYATKVHFDPAAHAAEPEIEYPLTGATEGIVLTANKATGTVAAALGSRLEVWPEGKRGEARQAYENPIRALSWTPAGLLVGEAGRVHLADPATGASKRVIQLQTGQVLAIEPLNGTIADETESAPEPGNRLVVPPAVLFRGEAAGRELRVLNVDCAGAPGPWRVEYDSAKIPWLVMHPISGHNSGAVYMGVDPARYLPHTLAEGWVTVFMEGGSPPIPAKDSPAQVLLRVEPAPASARTLLWLWPTAGAPMRDASDPRGLAGLASKLAAPPLYFSHAESAEPVSAPLDAYQAIVLSAGAAVRGVVTRQALVDYVADGGGLLVVGGIDKEQAEMLGPWLSPFGMVTAANPPQNTGTVRAAAEPLRNWPTMPAPAAYGFRTASAAKDVFAPPAMKVLRAPEEPADAPALFLARSFGYGRVALLASDALLRAASAGGPSGDFVRELFIWLAGAGMSAQDMDRDGLTDDLEDINGNGVRDPGETDWMRADTDGDGVPDGLEDWNRNGTPDPGETDPRNLDTDGDGVWDGSDPSPTPVFDAPRIAGLIPYTGPAEGGGVVLVRGKGLLPSAEYRFGGQPAESIAPGDGTMALVRVPEFTEDGGGTVTVSVVLPGQGLHAELPGGYRYMPRSLATVTLAEAGRPVVQNGTVRGRLRVMLTVSPHAPRLDVSISLDAPQLPGFGWQAEPIKNSRLRVIAGPEGSINISGAVRLNRAEGVPVAEVGWHCSGTGVNTVEFVAPHLVARTPEGGRLLGEGKGIASMLPLK